MKQNEIKKRSQEIISAIDNLSTIAHMDLSNTKYLDIDENDNIIINHIGKNEDIEWISEEKIINIIKENYFVIDHYLHKLFEEIINFNEKEVASEVKQIIMLVGESAMMFDNFFDKQKNLTILPLAKSEEYLKIKSFFVNDISKKLNIDIEEEWAKTWDLNDNALILNIEKSSIKEFESIKKDESYELFYIKDSNNKDIFNEENLKNIKLFYNFNTYENDSLIKDPLIQIFSLMDTNSYFQAEQILKYIKSDFKKFLNNKQNDRQNYLIKNIFKLFMALLIAANDKNLIKNSVGKSCYKYFKDCQLFLRIALNSFEYQKTIIYSKQDYKENELIIHILHYICFLMYTKIFSIKKEILAIIYKLIRLGEQVTIQKNKYNKKGFWEKLIQNNENINNILKQYPSGPLLKDLDVIIEKASVFDPMLQGNTPYQMINLIVNNKEVAFLHMPCPTQQTIINKAKIIPEFIGFLKYLTNQQQVCLINLQERTNLQEIARCNEIEKLQYIAEFNDLLQVITLDKHTSFYYQTHEYKDITSAKAFKKSLYSEVLKPSQDGLHFPNILLANKQFNDFIKNTIEFIHEIVFLNKNVLSKFEKTVFIDIFYNFLILKLMEINKIDYISFISKDGVDTPAIAIAEFYIFIKILKQEKLMKKDEENILYLIYSTALLIRERSVNIQKLNNMISSMQLFDEMINPKNKKTFVKIKQLFSVKFLKSLKLN